MENTRRATHFLVALLVLMLFMFILAAIPADAKESRPDLSPAGSSRVPDLLPTTPASAPIIEVDCVFPALDGTCSGSVSFQPVVPKRLKPAARPGSHRRNNRWQIGFLYSPDGIA